eukprot:gene56215-65647_t
MAAAAGRVCGPGDWCRVAAAAVFITGLGLLASTLHPAETPPPVPPFVRRDPIPGAAGTPRPASAAPMRPSAAAGAAAPAAAAAAAAALAAAAAAAGPPGGGGSAAGGDADRRAGREGDGGYAAEGELPPAARARMERLRRDCAARGARDAGGGAAEAVPGMRVMMMNFPATMTPAPGEAESRRLPVLDRSTPLASLAHSELLLPQRVADLGLGAYAVRFRPRLPGRRKLCVHLFYGQEPDLHPRCVEIEALGPPRLPATAKAAWRCLGGRSLLWFGDSTLRATNMVELVLGTPVLGDKSFKWVLAHCSRHVLPRQGGTRRVRGSARKLSLAGKEAAKRGCPDYNTIRSWAGPQRVHLRFVWGGGWAKNTLWGIRPAALDHTLPGEGGQRGGERKDAWSGGEAATAAYVKHAVR